MLRMQELRSSAILLGIAAIRAGRLESDLRGHDQVAWITRERQVRPVVDSVAWGQEVQDAARRDQRDQVRSAAINVVQESARVLRMIQRIAELAEEFQVYPLRQSESLHQAQVDVV